MGGFQAQRSSNSGLWWFLVCLSELTHWPLGGLTSLKLVNFKLISMINIWSTFCQIAIWWMLHCLTDHSSTVFQVMAWCRQATSHYLSQCWLRSLSPYGVIGPQWVKLWYVFTAQKPVMRKGFPWHDGFISCFSYAGDAADSTGVRRSCVLSGKLGKYWQHWPLPSCRLQVTEGHFNIWWYCQTSNIRHQIPKLKWFWSRLAVVFSQSI